MKTAAVLHQPPLITNNAINVNFCFLVPFLWKSFLSFESIAFFLYILIIIIKISLRHRPAAIAYQYKPSSRSGAAYWYSGTDNTKGHFSCY